MAPAPLLTMKQFRSIEPDLPVSRRDRLVISAVLFRATSGQSLRETSESFGVSRVRLNEWEHALDCVLARIMHKLRLAPAPASMLRRGGQDWRKRSGVYERVTTLRLQDFGTALRRTARS